MASQSRMTAQGQEAPFLHFVQLYVASVEEAQKEQLVEVALPAEGEADGTLTTWIAELLAQMATSMLEHRTTCTPQTVLAIAMVLVALPPPVQDQVGVATHKRGKRHLQHLPTMDVKAAPVPVRIERHLWNKHKLGAEQQRLQRLPCRKSWIRVASRTY
eukprot:gb/GFBE01061559.1/.p1 GENE.gb/GFBE01061559.1/~~gb/GFBE01061559.1/.p1  ORF type:complete len:159 (+),score=41.48 gb/GFBE01061559.1/:1-477(+)